MSKFSHHLFLTKKCSDSKDWSGEINRWDTLSQTYCHEQLLVLPVHVIQSLDYFLKNISESLNESWSVDIEGWERSVVVDWLVLSSSFSKKKSQTKSRYHESSQPKQDNQRKHVTHSYWNHWSNCSQDSSQSSNSQSSLSGCRSYSWRSNSSIRCTRSCRGHDYSHWCSNYSGNNESFHFDCKSTRGETLLPKMNKTSRKLTVWWRKMSCTSVCLRVKRKLWRQIIFSVLLVYPKYSIQTHEFSQKDCDQHTQTDGKQEKLPK